MGAQEATAQMKVRVFDQLDQPFDCGSAPFFRDKIRLESPYIVVLLVLSDSRSSLTYKSLRPSTLDLRGEVAAVRRIIIVVEQARRCR